MANLYWYEGPAANGQKVTGLTLADALDLQRKEDLQREENEMNAKLGPQISAGIHGYEARKLQEQQPQPAMSSAGSAPAVSIQGMSDSGNIQPVSMGSQFEGTPAFDSVSSNPSSISGMVNNNSFRSPPSNQERAASASFMALTEGIPEELTNDLIARYRMGELKPSAFVKEVIAIKKTLSDDKRTKEKEDYLSKNRMAEDKNKAFFDTEDKLLELDSQERMNTQDNQTQLEGYRIQAENQRDNNRAQTAALKAGEFDVKEKDMLQSVEEGRLLLTGLVETFKNNKFGGAGDVVGEGAAKIPFAGKFVAGKNKEYQNQKRLAAETWLRAATGAAAPDYEVDTYVGFLPNESDPPEIADKKVANFFSKLSAKVNARAKIFEIEGAALEQRGLIDLANIKYTQAELVKQMIGNAKTSIPTIVEKKQPGQVSGGGSSRSTGNVIKSKSGNVYNLD